MHASQRKSPLPPHAAPQQELTLSIPAGDLHVRRHGSKEPLAIGVPGLSANRFSFEALGKAHPALAALDLRGRGRSPAGARGTHGWENHAKDILDAATALGAEQFDLIGHSMGAFISLVVANRAPQRVRRLVLIDGAGVPDPLAMGPIYAAVTRLGTVYPSAEDFLGKVAGAGIVPWSPFWERHYREDLVEVPGGGVRQRASRHAVVEDLAYGSLQVGVRNLWPGVRAPTLLVRASLPIGGGHVVTPCDRDAFQRTVPSAQVVEVPANHYGVMNHPTTAAAVSEFLQ